MRRRRDRVVSYLASGEPEFYGSNGTLPRRTYRDFERGSLYDPALPAVYIGRAVARRRLPAFSTRVSLRYPIPAKQIAQRSSKAMSLWSPVRAILNRMPSRVIFCFQRKVRREVLFAMSRAGFSGSASKSSYRRTANSNYGC